MMAIAIVRVTRVSRPALAKPTATTSRVTLVTNTTRAATGFCTAIDLAPPVLWFGTTSQNCVTIHPAPAIVS